MGKRREPNQVYMLTFPNGMVYVGCTCDVKSRWNGRGAGYKYLEVGKAIEEFGWDNIKKDVVFQLPEGCEGSAELCKYIEDFLIKRFENNNYNVKGTCRDKEKIKIPVFGETLTLSEMIDRYGSAKVAVAYNRLKRFNVTIEEALTLPPAPHNMRRNPGEYWHSLGYDIEELSAEEKKKISTCNSRHGSVWEVIAARQCNSE